MENIEISKAIRTGKIPGRVSKDSLGIFSKLVSKIWYHSTSHEIFPNACKVVKLKLIF